MLILFDIDLTLLRSHGVGVRSMHAACRELFGSDITFEGVEIAGRLDDLIWRDVARLNGLDESPVTRQAFRTAYGHALEMTLADGGVDVLPGVPALVETLRGRDDLTIGLLTGNYPETGAMKLRAAGLDPDHFAIAAWGCDGAARRDLPAVAMRRYQEHTGREIRADLVTIIGDTPHDVDCARTSGCRALGVATGQSTAAELAAAGADRVVEDLSDTGGIVEWLLSPAGAAAS